MNQNSRLKEIFLSLLFEDDSAELFTNAEVIYKDLTRKLCNIRLQEFISSQKQRFASAKGQATSGQNLRDTLLTMHINLQSRRINLIHSFH